MWELDHKESWSLKNWSFRTVVLEKNLESPFDSKEIKPVNPKGNKSWIFIGRMLKLKLQYFGHLMWKTDSLEKTLMMGNTDGRRKRGWWGWDGWMALLTQLAWVWASSRSWWWTERPGLLQSMGSQRIRHNWATELNWTEVLLQGAKEGRMRMNAREKRSRDRRSPGQSWLLSLVTWSQGQCCRFS